MTENKNPSRSRGFRLTTILVAGTGGFVLGLWALSNSFEGNVLSSPVGILIALLCGLSAAVAAFSFFAGVRESASYVFNETQVDKLTGLHARTAMVGKIAEAACATEVSREPIHLIDVDINRFKQINDAIGYGQGDALIRAFAIRLRNWLPPAIEVGRIGAGEFALLCPHRLAKPSVEVMVESLIAQMTRPYPLASHLQSVNLSVGIVSMPRDGVDPVQLLRRSNLALQHARSAGADNFAVFGEEMGQVAEYRQWIEAELGTAFERGDFEMHYQPQFDLSTGRVVGYEALMRWPHPLRGMISPMEFIPIAEETGMISQLGEWALRKACNDARALPEDCVIAVNISPVQFMTRDFVALVRRVLEESGMSPRRLELEVTETAMMQDRSRAAEILMQLTQMGISVAVDDFGTGYSNLSYLIDFKFHKLKIDRSFVNRMEADNGSGAVISSIVGLSRALGVRTIAEGVETESQATLLKAAGCEAVQGYFYGKPAPLRASGNETPHASRMH